MVDTMTIAVSFAAGIFGAAFGALPAFILCGLFGIIGATARMCGIAEGMPDTLTWGLLVIGCQTSFGGGIAAAAYAAKKGYIPSGRDICSGLMGLNKSDVLFVGGIFGIVGQLLFLLFNMVPNINGIAWTNTIALAVVISGCIARVIFRSQSPFGKVKAGTSRWKPTDQACWLPWQSKPSQLLLIGLGMGISSAYIITTTPDMIYMMFGIGAFGLIFMQMGGKIPVTHHIGLAAGYFAIITGNFWWALTMGIMASYLAEFFACIFLIHGDSHIDPPTWSLVAVFTLHPLISLTGVLDKNPEGVLTAPAWIPVACCMVVAASGYGALTLLRKEPIADKLAEKQAA
ncbi:MAG: permease [Phycisphaerae bacterium]|nr:permease [Phycisphaerae bacterium]